MKSESVTPILKKLKKLKHSPDRKIPTADKFFAKKLRRSGVNVEITVTK